MMELPSDIMIQCPAVTPRMEYVAGYLATALGIRVDLKTAHEKESATLSHDPGLCRINYGDTPLSGMFNIYASGLLGETGIRSPEPAVLKKDGQIMLFPAPEGFDLPFDLFSAVFYLITRYEEYLPYQPDANGRFEADQSLAFHYNFLEEPVVDQWTGMLKKALAEKYPQLVLTRQKFRFESTFDVDNPWAYLHKGLLRTTGGLIKQVILPDFAEFKVRLDVLRGKSPDPYDTYDYILGIERQYAFISRFFFLSGGYGRHDTNYALGTPAFSELLTRLSHGRTIGIHPSYRSSQSLQMLQSEVDRFSRILGRKPDSSRQHFLALRLPETYRRLISMGFKTDHTMGYASRIGFRAGTSRPFRFYDLPEDRETNLIVQPFLIMDVTLQQYMNLSCEEALDKILSMIKTVRATDGVFTSLWHNESLSERGVWKGWRTVFEGMVSAVTSNE